MTTIKVGDEVQVRILRHEGGSSMVSPDHPDFGSYPKVWCRVAQIGICGVPDIYGLAYGDGSPVGLPFWRESFLKVRKAR